MPNERAARFEKRVHVLKALGLAVAGTRTNHDNLMRIADDVPNTKLIALYLGMDRLAEYSELTARRNRCFVNHCCSASWSFTIAP